MCLSQLRWIPASNLQDHFRNIFCCVRHENAVSCDTATVWQGKEQYSGMDWGCGFYNSFPNVLHWPHLHCSPDALARGGRFVTTYLVFGFWCLAVRVSSFVWTAAPNSEIIFFGCVCATLDPGLIIHQLIYWFVELLIDWHYCWRVPMWCDKVSAV